MSTKPLTPKQAAFVREYLIDLNASAAYRRAGYAGKGRTVEVNSSKLLRNTEVASAIQGAMEDRRKRVEITSDQVLKNIIEIGQRCLQRDPVMIGKGKDRKQLTQEIVDPDTGEEILAQVFQFDAQGALRAQELLGKHLKMFTDKVEHSGAVTVLASPMDERL
jgi:phage terminase small subunit